LAIDRFEALEIPLPSIDEQRSVASKLDVLCSRARKMEEQLQRENGDMWLTTFPALIDVMFARSAGTPAAVGDLVDIVSDVVHPGDDPGAATQFVGLQHVESHSGRCIGSDPIGNESGRKFRFMPGDIVYGYLRPYLNKVWLADRHGLCSVDQYVLRPRDGVDADLLSYALRSRSALDQAVQMTHSLQLPRLRSGLLASMVVPWLEGRGRLSIRSQLELVSRSLSAAVQLRRDQARIAKSLIPSMLNSAFAGLL
jgi:hypothetical protein